jgi:hypothetical protein
MATHRLAALCAESRPLTLAEFDVRLRTSFLEAYHRREPAETKTPAAERWEVNGFLPRMPERWGRLDTSWRSASPVLVGPGDVRGNHPNHW